MTTATFLHLDTSKKYGYEYTVIFENVIIKNQPEFFGKNVDIA